MTASRGTALCASPGDCSVAMHTSVFHSAHDTASPPYPSHPEAACDPSSRPRAPETSSSARAMSLAIPLRHCTTLNAHVDFGRVGRPFLGPFLSAKRPVNGPAGGLAGACRPIELRRTAPQVQTLPSVPRLPMAEAGTPTNGIAACSAGCEIAPAQGPESLPGYRRVSVRHGGCMSHRGDDARRRPERAASAREGSSESRTHGREHGVVADARALPMRVVAVAGLTLCLLAHLADAATSRRSILVAYDDSLRPAAYGA